jgi:tetratricopeptide (TPR) repeat protein
MMDIPSMVRSDRPLATPAGAPRWCIDRWAIPGGEKTVIAFVFVLACSLRLAYLYQLSRAPFFDDPIGDSQIYYQRALRILSGDWLGSEIYFHSSPPYPYLVALVMGATGGSFLALGVVQALVGAGNCVLVYLLARRLAGGERLAPLVAGVMAACYGLFVFMDCELLMMFLTLAFVDASLLLLLRARDSARWRWPVLAGVALGLAALDKTNVLLFAPFAAWWLAGDLSLQWRTWRWRPAALFSLAVALTVLPVTIRNYVVGGDLVLVSSNAGVNLYIGNNPDANGVFNLPQSSGLLNTDLYGSSVRVAEAALGRTLKPSEVSAFWSERAWRFVREQPWAAVKLVGWKALLLLNAREIPNHLDFYLVRKYFAPILKLMFVGYWMVVPLALLGMAWRVRQGFGAAGRLYIAFVVTYAVSLMPFFLSERYRLPLVPVLIPFAAEAALQLLRIARGGEWGRLKSLAAGLAAAAVLVNYPVAERFEFQSMFHEVIATKYLEHAMRDPAARADDVQQAILGFKEALEENPASVVAHVNLGTAYRVAGFISGAISEWNLALLLDPGASAARAARDAAVRDFRSSRDRVTAEALPMTPFEQARALLIAGFAEEARSRLEQVLEDEPFNDGAYASLASYHRQRGRLEDALRILERGLRHNPDSVVLLDSSGAVEFELHRYGEARRRWTRCLELAPADDGVTRELAALPAGT